MVLSQTSEYALRAVLFIAGPSAGATASVDGIVRALGMPASYVAKVLQTLTKAGILLATRGRTGGYRLAVPAEELSLAMVIAPFSEGGERRHCLLGRATCSDAEPCAAHHTWKATADDIARYFRATTIADLKGPVTQLTQG